LRRLIINADDFGYTRGVNRAIVECAQAGVVTSATLMANGQAVDDAVALANRARMFVGCHTVLVDGQPISRSIPSLAADGSFQSSIPSLMKRALLNEIDSADVFREAQAQFAKLRSVGIDLSHVDTHKHAHMFPGIFRPLLEAAKQAGIPAIRNPFEPVSIGWLAFPSVWVRGAQTSTLRLFHSSFRKAVKEFGLRTTDGTVGIAVTGLLDLNWLTRIIQGLPEGTWELVCHPGYADADLNAANTRLRESREVELKALLSGEFKKVLRSERIDLISYAEL
jgi:hopanoid biosynthesis associated protein HpnK